MSLRGSCIICTDYFDSENDISVTPCGHLFHAICLNQWIKASGKQTCPQCRMSIAQKRIIAKIYVNAPEEDDNHLDAYVLKNKLDEVQGLLKKSNSENIDLHSSLKAMESAKDKLMSKIKNLKSESNRDQNTIYLLKSDIDTLKTELSHTNALKSEIKDLKIRLKTLEKVEICINGQKSDVDEMLAQYSQPSSSKEAKQLATFCVAMKQEYETLKESRGKLNKEVMKLKRELHKSNELLLCKLAAVEELEKTNSSLQQSEEALHRENQSLQQKVKKLQLAISSPSDTRTSAINRLISESPVPECFTPVNGLPVKKIKQKKPILSCEPNKKPCLSSSFESTQVNLNDNNDMIESTSDIPLYVSDTPDQSKVKKQPQAQKENLLIKNACKSKNTDLKANFVNPLSIRNKLLSSKCTSGQPIGYDGLGGHRKLSLQNSCNSSVKSHKFSSTHSTAFKEATAKKLMLNQNRFNRLKRVCPN